MKVLSFNTGYFLDYNGTYSDYLENPGKSIYGSNNEQENLDTFCDLVNSKNPDIVLTQEVDGGSFRSSFDGQSEYIGKKLEYYNQYFDRKYRGAIFKRLPMLRHMGNSVFIKEGNVKIHRLSIGRKNLVQEIQFDEFSIFSLHLSTFGGWIRKRQLKEIQTIIERRKDFVLAGDLNFHKGRKEIEYLEQLTSNKVLSPGKTFPASNPERKLDLVICSGGLEISNLESLDQTFSDHRPILFEVEKN